MNILVLRIFSDHIPRSGGGGGFFPRLRGFWEKIINNPPALFFFFFSPLFFNGDQLVHTDSTFLTRDNPQWLSELRRLWPSVP